MDEGSKRSCEEDLVLHDGDGMEESVVNAECQSMPKILLIGVEDERGEKCLKEREGGSRGSGPAGFDSRFSARCDGERASGDLDESSPLSEKRLATATRCYEDALRLLWNY
jgi:hypothetical protein